jgi:hypothetical protein
MPSDADALRQEIRALHEHRMRGDVSERRYQPRLAEKSVALTRLVASAKLEPGEAIVADHHVEHSHFKFTQSVLREPEQITASFFASDRRLIRVRSVLSPSRPFSCDEGDGTEVDDLPYALIERVVARTELRPGEAAAGLVIALLALLLRNTLAVTGPALLILGIAGVLHGLLLPTRWVEVVARGTPPRSPFEIHATRKRSGRALLRTMREGMRRQKP